MQIVLYQLRIELEVAAAIAIVGMPADGIAFQPLLRILRQVHRLPIAHLFEVKRVSKIISQEALTHQQHLIAFFGHAEKCLHVHLAEIQQFHRQHQHCLTMHGVGLMQLVERLPLHAVALGHRGVHHTVEHLTAERLCALRTERRLPNEALRHAVLHRKHQHEESDDAKDVDARELHASPPS